MYGSSLNFTTKYKYLGVIIVSGKTFTSHMNPLIKFCSAANTDSMSKQNRQNISWRNYYTPLVFLSWHMLVRPLYTQQSRFILSIEHLLIAYAKSFITIDGKAYASFIFQWAIHLWRIIVTNVGRHSWKTFRSWAIYIVVSNELSPWLLRSPTVSICPFSHLYL